MAFAFYLMGAFLLFSALGISGVLFDGHFRPSGEGLVDGAKVLVKESMSRFSGVRVGSAFVVSLAIHRFSVLSGTGGSLMFGILFLVFFVLAGPVRLSVRK
jgi:hypothetical protein